MKKVIYLIIVSLMMSCVSVYGPILQNNQEVFVPIDRDSQGFTNNFNLEANYRSPSTLKVFVGILDAGTSYNLQLTDTIKYNSSHKNSSFNSLALTGGIFGGLYTPDQLESKYFEYGVTGQLDYRYFNNFTFGATYATAFEFGGSYSRYKKELLSLNDDNSLLDPSITIKDLSSNGYSSLFSIYMETPISKNNLSCRFYMSLEDTNSLNPLREMVFDPNLIFISLFTDITMFTVKSDLGFYIILNRENTQYFKFSLTKMCSLSLAMGTTF